MLVPQKIYLAFILVPGIVLGVTMIALNKNIGLWLAKYGLIVGFPGITLSVLFGKKLSDVLLLIDVSGFGRAYLCGCMLLLAGVIVQAWHFISRLEK